jgi:hypothetical protein
MNSYILIDPPVTPYSPVEKIQTWLDTLKKMPEQDYPEVKKAIADAESMLKNSTELYQRMRDNNHE